MAHPRCVIEGGHRCRTRYLSIRGTSRAQPQPRNGATRSTLSRMLRVARAPAPPFLASPWATSSVVRSTHAVDLLRTRTSPPHPFSLSYRALYCVHYRTTGHAHTPPTAHASISIYCRSHRLSCTRRPLARRESRCRATASLGPLLTPALLTPCHPHVTTVAILIFSSLCALSECWLAVRASRPCRLTHAVRVGTCPPSPSLAPPPHPTPSSSSSSLVCSPPSVPPPFSSAHTLRCCAAGAYRLPSTGPPSTTPVLSSSSSLRVAVAQEESTPLMREPLRLSLFVSLASSAAHVCVSPAALLASPLPPSFKRCFSLGSGSRRCGAPPTATPPSACWRCSLALCLARAVLFCSLPPHPHF